MIGGAIAAAIVMQISGEASEQLPSTQDPYVLPRVMLYDYKHGDATVGSWITIPARAATRKGPVETIFLFQYTDPAQTWPPLNAKPWVNVIYYKVPGSGAEPDKIIDSVTGFILDGDRIGLLPLKIKTLERVKIVAYGKEPPGSGILHTYRQITVREGERPIDLYVTWLGEGQDMPSIGAVCDIKWYWDWVDGWGHADDGRELRPDRVMEDFSCRP